MASNVILCVFTTFVAFDLLFPHEIWLPVMLELSVDVANSNSDSVGYVSHSLNSYWLRVYVHAFAYVQNQQQQQQIQNRKQLIHPIISRRRRHKPKSCIHVCYIFKSNQRRGSFNGLSFFHST